MELKSDFGGGGGVGGLYLFSQNGSKGFKNVLNVIPQSSPMVYLFWMMFSICLVSSQVLAPLSCSK
jgi:hypothetical protein